MSKEETSEDFRAFWQRPPFIIVGILLFLICAVLLIARLDLFSWGADRVNDALGEARYFQKMVDEDILDQSPIGRLHSKAFPNYISAIFQSNYPAEDERITTQFQTLQTLAGDQELQSILTRWHADIVAGNTDLLTHESAWNARLQQLNQGYAIVGGTIDDHDHPKYMPEFYRIHATPTVLVDHKRFDIQWRQRLDGFRRAGVSTFYHPELDQSWVRTDRAWSTLWNHMSDAVLTDEDIEGIEEDFRFQWRPQFQQEVRTILGEDQFEAFRQASIKRRQLRSIATDIATRGNRCGHRYRIASIPWMGFDSEALERMKLIARTDRFENCPRLTEQEATRIRRHSRDLQSDLSFQQAMPRLLAAFLQQKSIIAAAHHFRASSTDHKPCTDCSWTDLDAAEIGGYLSGISHGPHPHLQLFKLCFSHRYGSPESYRGWLMMLRDEEFLCRNSLPEDLFDRLSTIEKERFSPIGSIRFHGEPPTTAPISRRD